MTDEPAQEACREALVEHFMRALDEAEASHASRTGSAPPTPGTSPVGDPARVLAECAANRQLVERAKYAAVHALNDDRTDYADDEYREIVLPILALPYATHPDYQQEWAP